MRRIAAALPIILLSLPLFAQDAEAPPAASQWTWKERIEIRANYRNSREQKVAVKFPFPPDFLPVGQKQGFLETVNAGRHTELSVAQLQLDLGYGKYFAARAKLHGQDKYRRNPTSEDRKIDADELWIRFGEKPEFLDLPSGTSFFAQFGKAPKMERQPTRLLESYGLASTSFNRFEDIQALVGGSVGRHLYWRLQLANGNPFYFRDPNALAGDNGISLLLTKNPDPPLKAGFPILYNAESEGYFFNRDHVQFGQGLGWKWAREDGGAGFDALVYHYRRDMADRDELTGTFYGADLDFLKGPFDMFGLPISGRRKEETGARVYAEWRDLTVNLQYTKQFVAGLHRAGHEAEIGYKIPTAFGPSIGGESLFQYLQPAFRVSGLRNDFRAKADKRYPAPSVWWPWTKLDYGVRIGLAKGIDITAERTKHNIGAPVKVNPSETLVTLRIRV